MRWICASFQLNVTDVPHGTRLSSASLSDSQTTHSTSQSFSSDNISASRTQLSHVSLTYNVREGNRAENSHTRGIIRPRSTSRSSYIWGSGKLTHWEMGRDTEGRGFDPQWRRFRRCACRQGHFTPVLCLGLKLHVILTVECWESLSLLK